MNTKHFTTLTTVATTCLVLLTGVAAATTYYVDAVSGNDANNGLTTATAWQTTAKVCNTWIYPGDTVLFKRGQIWRSQIIFYLSGTAEQPVTFGAYGSGENPVITGSDPVTGWTQVAATQYAVAAPNAIELVIINGVKGTYVASTAELNAAGKWNWSNGVLTIYSMGAPTNVEVATRKFLLAFPGNDYVTVENMTIRHGDFPVYLYNTNHVVLDNLTIHDNIGTGGVAVVSDTDGRGQYNTIQNCEVYNTTGDSASLANGDNGNGIFVYSEYCRYNVIANNIVHHNGNEGIGILLGSDNVVAGNTVYEHAQSGIRVGLETASRNTIERNESYANCREVDDRFGIDLIRVGDDNVVRYNLVHDQHIVAGGAYGSGGIRFDGGDWEGHNHMDSDGNVAYYNVIYNEYVGIESFNFDNVEIYNNVVYNSGWFGLVVQSVFEIDGIDNVVANNIFDTAGTGLVFHYRNVNTVFANNVYHANGAANFVWKEGDTYHHVDLAGWQALSGQDIESIVADPLFASVAEADFSLTVASPCIDFALDLGFGFDYANNAVPAGYGPDAGAFEYTGSHGSGTDPVTVTIESAAADHTNAAIPVTVTFSMPVTGFAANDVLAGNATVGSFAGSGDTYTFVLNPLGQGLVTAYVPAGVAENVIGDGNEASLLFGRVYDSVAPTATVSSSVAYRTRSNPIPMKVTFSEPVTGFAAADITVANGAVANFSGSGSVYSFVVRPYRAGTVTVAVGANKAVDSAANGNAASVAFSRLYSSR
ncbi:MAG TPA: right-handed parallel beta-helix repeat-containing protein [Candidatus Hydrogenedentes bacterium]|mgnify:CR=1 FL=1|nr:right-handed parallel beta-helix repeat-containing protein [Candidatus Hydrogenedentota bacterium]HPG67974.1 right-handed parallel beta-helix repeat-containing protein [Candidatus Hydrogenedentota bacterium]